MCVFSLQEKNQKAAPPIKEIQNFYHSDSDQVTAVQWNNTKKPHPAYSQRKQMGIVMAVLYRAHISL